MTYGAVYVSEKKHMKTRVFRVDWSLSSIIKYVLY